MSAIQSDSIVYKRQSGFGVQTQKRILLIDDGTMWNIWIFEYVKCNANSPPLSAIQSDSINQSLTETAQNK